MRSNAPSTVASVALGLAISRISAAASFSVARNSGELRAAFRIVCRSACVVKDTPLCWGVAGMGYGVADFGRRTMSLLPTIFGIAVAVRAPSVNLRVLYL